MRQEGLHWKHSEGFTGSILSTARVEDRARVLLVLLIDYGKGKCRYTCTWPHQMSWYIVIWGYVHYISSSGEKHGGNRWRLNMAPCRGQGQRPRTQCLPCGSLREVSLTLQVGPQPAVGIEPRSWKMCGTSHSPRGPLNEANPGAGFAVQSEYKMTAWDMVHPLWWGLL